MSFELAKKIRDYSDVIRQQCLDNMGSSAPKSPEYVEQYYKQGSTGLGSGVVTVGQLFSVRTWITTEASTASEASHDYIKAVNRPIPVEDNLANVLKNLRDSLERPYTKNLIDRLEFLAKPSEDLSEPTLSLGSLKQFISFIKSHNFQQPELVLSFDGNVRAEWWQDRAHHFAAEFLPDGLVKIVEFVESPIDPNKVERISGTPSLGKLKAIMESTGAKWCFA